MECSGGCHAQQDAFQGEGYYPRCPECGNYHRDLTPAFQGLVMEACAAVIPSSRRLHREFKIDAAGTTWQADPQTRFFSIRVPGAGRAISQYHAVGTWIEKSGSFKWSWAWDDKDRPDVTKAADHARRVGTHYWLRSLTAPTLYVGETEAWQLAMVTAYLSDHPAVTAVPTENGKAFLVLERPIREN